MLTIKILSLVLIIGGMFVLGKKTLGKEERKTTKHFAVVIGAFLTIIFGMILPKLISTPKENFVFLNDKTPTLIKEKSSSNIKKDYFDFNIKIISNISGLKKIDWFEFENKSIIGNNTKLKTMEYAFINLTEYKKIRGNIIKEFKAKTINKKEIQVFLGDKIPVDRNNKVILVKNGFSFSLTPYLITGKLYLNYKCKYQWIDAKEDINFEDVKGQKTDFMQRIPKNKVILIKNIFGNRKEKKIFLIIKPHFKK